MVLVHVNHGGTVEIENVETGGTQFTVEIRAEQSLMGFESANIDETDLPRLDGVRLLFVDDHEDTRALVSQMLSEMGAQVERRDRSRYGLIVTCLVNMGPVTATAQTVAVVNRWKPRYVLLVGIACGIPGEVNHGDVIVASQVADYTLGKQSKGKRQIRWEVFPCGASLLDSSNNVRGDWHKR